MKVYSREQLIKRFKICVVLGVIMAIAMVAINLSGMLGDISVGGVFMWAIALIIGLIAFPVWCLGVSFNFGKMMLGLIAPIPLLSYFIEACKAYVYGIKAIIVIVKKKDSLVVGKKKAQVEEE